MKDQFKAYFKALNKHDIDRVLNLFSEEFELHFAGSDQTIGKSGMKSVLEWDKGVNGRVSYENLVAEGKTVSALFTEQNDFFKLIGIDELKSENSYLFGRNGLIVKQTYRMLPGQPSFIEKMQPAVEWARKNRPETLNEIYPGNRISYNLEAARKWVSLLEEWKREVETG